MSHGKIEIIFCRGDGPDWIGDHLNIIFNYFDLIEYPWNIPFLMSSPCFAVDNKHTKSQDNEFGSSTISHLFRKRLLYQ